MEISLVRAKDPGVDPMMPVLSWAAFRSAFSFSLRLCDLIMAGPNTRGCNSTPCCQRKIAVAADSWLLPRPHFTTLKRSAHRIPFETSQVAAAVV